MSQSARPNRTLNWILAGILAIAVTLLPAPLTWAGELGVPLSPILLVSSQKQPDTAVVTLANQFVVTKAQLSDFLDRWTAIGEYMKQQPGFVSAELHKDILNPQEWVMSEQWKSLRDYQKAISSETFQSLIQDFPGKATWFANDLFSSR